MPDATQAPGNSVTVSMVKGEWLIIVVDQVAFNVEVGKAPILLVGENTVEITEAYAQFIDEYQFVPTATKKYSRTVPAGVEVLMNDEDFIVGEDRTVNFEA
ncbi:MAG: hypothetical protein K2G26_02175, partial [Clostridia bacterium]|nr:hypothetical protein [Clostridia bacterium]